MRSRRLLLGLRGTSACYLALVSDSVVSSFSPSSHRRGRIKRHSSPFLAKKDGSDSSDDFISDFCIGTNTFWKKLVIKPVRDYVDARPAELTAESSPIDTLISRPEIPGIPRPVWLTILGSVPTGLVWYGYYKFSVEEELYQYEVS